MDGSRCQWLPMWDANFATGIQFSACVRLRMLLTLGKFANLNHSLNGGLLLTSNTLSRRYPLVYETPSLYTIKIKREQIRPKYDGVFL